MLKTTFSEYTEFVKNTAFYPGSDFIYPVLGLVGESGEVADKIKKIIRDHDGKMSEEQRDAIVRELGDVMWYLTQLSVSLGVTLDDVVRTNMEKISDRRNRGTLSGDGDYR